MNIKDMLTKIGEMDSEHISLIIDCGIIISELKEEEQDKLLKLIDVVIKYQKEKWKKENTLDGKGEKE